jgi:cytochrome P450
MTQAVDTFPQPRDKKCPFDPASLYNEVRRSGPRQVVNSVTGEPAWLVAGYDDARTLLVDKRLSSDIRRPGFPTFSPGIQNLVGGTFIFLDPPDHDRIRRTIAPEFTPRRVAARRPLVDAIVDELIDDLEANGSPADLVSGLSLHVPTRVIGEILGVPRADHPMIQELLMVAFRLESTVEETREATAKFVEYINGLMEAKAKAPADDLMSRLMTGPVVEGAVTLDEARDAARLLVTGGFDTTGNSIALGVLVLLERPDQLAALRADASLMPACVDEVLRYSSITQGGRRRAALEDIEVGDVTIRAGEGVIIAQDAANRDPDAFEGPDEFDIRRTPNPHLTFGLGVHACIGRSLAILEMEVTFTKLFDRLPNLRLATPLSELRWKTDSHTYGVYEAPIEW